METDDREIAPCLKNDRMASLHGLPTSKSAAKKRKDRNKSPAGAAITAHAHLARWGTATTSVGMKIHPRMKAHDGVKGKTASHSNQLSALIGYLAKVGSHQTRGSVRLGHCCIIQAAKW